jgi:hypothetical protein
MNLYIEVLGGKAFVGIVLDTVLSFGDVNESIYSSVFTSFF